jgi:hypothetical protein
MGAYTEGLSGAALEAGEAEFFASYGKLHLFFIHT